MSVKQIIYFTKEHSRHIFRQVSTWSEWLLCPLLTTGAVWWNLLEGTKYQAYVFPLLSQETHCWSW